MWARPLTVSGRGADTHLGTAVAPPPFQAFVPGRHLGVFVNVCTTSFRGEAPSSGDVNALFSLRMSGLGLGPSVKRGLVTVPRLWAQKRALCPLTGVGDAGQFTLKRPDKPQTQATGVLCFTPFFTAHLHIFNNCFENTCHGTCI